MSIQKGRDLVLHIGDSAEEEEFTLIEAARAVSVSLNNNPVDATTLEDDVQVLRAEAGLQSMSISLDGHFRGAGAEEALRQAAFAATANSYKLVFPNGDVYQADFVVGAYGRNGTTEGLESFTVTLMRSGAGTFTAGVSA